MFVRIKEFHNCKIFSGMPAISVSLDNNSANTVKGTVCRSRICGHKVEGTDCGSDVSKWLSLALRLPDLRLIRQSDCDNKRKGIRHKVLSI